MKMPAAELNNINANTNNKLSSSKMSSLNPSNNKAKDSSTKRKKSNSNKKAETIEQVMVSPTNVMLSSDCSLQTQTSEDTVLATPVEGNNGTEFILTEEVDGKKHKELKKKDGKKFKQSKETSLKKVELNTSSAEVDNLVESSTSKETNATTETTIILPEEKASDADPIKRKRRVSEEIDNNNNNSQTDLTTSSTADSKKIKSDQPANIEEQTEEVQLPISGEYAQAAFQRIMTALSSNNLKSFLNNLTNPTQANREKIILGLNRTNTSKIFLGLLEVLKEGRSASGSLKVWCGDLIRLRGEVLLEDKAIHPQLLNLTSKIDSVIQQSAALIVLNSRLDMISNYRKQLLGSRTLNNASSSLSTQQEPADLLNEDEEHHNTSQSEVSSDEEFEAFADGRQSSYKPSDFLSDPEVDSSSDYESENNDGENGLDEDLLSD